ncbi:protein FAM229A isoform X3 [Gorilla gorilla gorilla]|uniref:protein FAM229A isoform X3 n=1 Tax=Gorilla gorilla gorilla TaxID=9595 RepID=UPI0008F4BD53|nr:protein FAM229A isoform X3 [Gorilla gorilla gorilla]XP_018870156.1 protein FAM229A isoform X3 [Gorilla gorilla gorilla]XP_055247050.1 protein FAM229A isoform X3 [Gorilla gorilla gorilla]
MLFTETAHFVVNFLLSRRPQATAPHRLDQELCFWGSRGPVLPAPAARRSLGDYWLSPQRRHLPGAAWRWPARNLLLLPPATGLADVPSARWPSCYGARPRLTWKHRWQNINYYFLGKRKRHLVPLRS